MSAKDELPLIDDPLFPLKPSARFKVFRMIDGRPHTKVAEYETEEELLKHPQRLDWHQAVEFTRQKYVPLPDFLKTLKR